MKLNMLHLTNFVTLIRGPLALLFLFKSPYLRLIAIFLALTSDVLDGYLARRFNQISKFGTILDPLMDKCFVYGAICIFYQEGTLSLECLLMMLTRDFCLLFYALIEGLKRQLGSITLRSINWGKVSTSLQFSCLLRICFNIPAPTYFYFPPSGRNCLLFY